MITEYVEKSIIKVTYPTCADLVNQLIQELKREGIEARMSLVGSGRRNLVTRYGNKPFDYDFNLEIVSAPNIMDCRWIKSRVMFHFNNVLRWNHLPDCCDSTSVITTRRLKLTKHKNADCKIDICIIRTDSYGYWYRLVHDKTGYVQLDRFHWDRGFNSSEVFRREDILRKDSAIWNEVREKYLEKKDMYLSRQDDNQPSFVCYTEVINEVYNKYYQRSINTVHVVEGFHSLYENINRW